jgi:hypothetical protein
VELLPHPGYGLIGHRTAAYLQTLSRYKVAICTTSKYGYALRKIIEATAVGCRVVSDLPVDDVLPEIDGNITRISIDNSTAEIASIVHDLAASYSDEQQRIYAEKAIKYYDYRRLGRQLAADIEALRRSYA